ncbi:type II toxin-antitoxin system HipA family toxin [Leptolyngbya iicbica]|uniref:Type II toxin-antitoxin system HipA family toxin n=2 Tax=Cyanophyceae TaxID=3028117 RepID=A0A4Q7E170_9CYAN|nr:HipA domain-containing protein [Leptolyngbya sp. LK]RZM75245.1 type II toxin-antitoxin system HipA family toxin [Leptolyngbya sp. LK]
MSKVKKIYGIWLYQRRIGSITLNGGIIRFQLDNDYVHDPTHAVLGLVFEDDLEAIHRSKNRLPPWFSNLLPEGRLRHWIAEDASVDENKEIELLLKVGHDLPGAIRVAEAEIGQTEFDSTRREIVSDADAGNLQRDIWRFSLAGVALKFSMLNVGERFTSPGVGEGGDWIIKLPDRSYRHVPINEFSMMELARRVGIDVPEVRLVHREQLADVPDDLWPEFENMAYAIQRFDRTPSRELIHIEDFAQVRNLYPHKKYTGTFETLANLIYRQYDTNSLIEFTRRLAFNYVIGNGDAHLKNWSLIYTDPRRPVLSPAYDLVSTAVYRPSGNPEDLGLKFAKSRSFDSVTLENFERLERKVNASGIGLRDVAHEVIQKTMSSWPEIEEILKDYPWLQKKIGEGISARTSAVLVKQ